MSFANFTNVAHSVCTKTNTAMCDTPVSLFQTENGEITTNVILINGDRLGIIMTMVGAHVEINLILCIKPKKIQHCPAVSLFQVYTRVGKALHT